MEQPLRHDDYAMTFDEIAAEMGVTRQRIQNIEKSAMKKLRERHPRTLALMLESMKSKSKGEAVRL